MVGLGGEVEVARRSWMGFRMAGDGGDGGTCVVVTGLDRGVEWRSAAA